MGSFFSRLFGGSSDKSEADYRSDRVPYKELEYCASPKRKGDSWLLAGVIIKPGPVTTHEDGESQRDDLERDFIRADTFSSRDEAETFALRKAKQIIDEQGQAMFADGAKTGRV